MKYNSKYDRWVTKGGLVYRYSKAQDKLVLCKLSANNKGYLQLQVSSPKSIVIKVHKLVYETFVGEIPQGYEIDHINTIRDDNRIENLRLVSHKENCNNPLTLQKRIGKATNKRNKAFSEFGKKYKEHFGIGSHENRSQYNAECAWYCKHKKCSWE
jgi:hypothetical protein